MKNVKKYYSYKELSKESQAKALMHECELWEGEHGKWIGSESDRDNWLTKEINKRPYKFDKAGNSLGIIDINYDSLDVADPFTNDQRLCYGEYEDGTPLTDDELIQLEIDDNCIVGDVTNDRYRN